MNSDNWNELKEYLEKEFKCADDRGDIARKIYNIIAINKMKEIARS